MPDRLPPSYLDAPSKPKLRLPKGATDAHVHIFGPGDRFAYAPGSNPQDGPKEKLFALHKMLGIDRCIVVQSLAHGFDNVAVEDALAAKGGLYKGVALLPIDVPDAEVRRLDAAGFCGIRYSYVQGFPIKPPRIEDVIALSKRLAAIGWHLQLQLDPPFYAEFAAALPRSAVPIVFDHMGRVDASLGIGQPAFQQILRLMDNPNFRMKVSGSERISRQPAPYRDAIPFGKKLVADFGDRVFWGSDWPHPGHSGDNIPDDGVLVDLIAEIAPSQSARQKLLVDNPESFYRLPKVA